MITFIFFFMLKKITIRIKNTRCSSEDGPEAVEKQEVQCGTDGYGSEAVRCACGSGGIGSTGQY